MTNGTKKANSKLIHEVELYLQFWSIVKADSTVVTRIGWYS